MNIFMQIYTYIHMYVRKFPRFIELCWHTKLSLAVNQRQGVPFPFPFPWVINTQNLLKRLLSALTELAERESLILSYVLYVGMYVYSYMALMYIHMYIAVIMDNQ